MYYIGLDPSFTATGISVIDTSHKELVFSSVGSSIGEKTFLNMVNKVEVQVSSILSIISKYDAVVITETPPATGYFSSGLYALDTYLSIVLMNKFSRVYGVGPTFLGHIHGTRKYKKSDSVILAKNFISLFSNDGYKVTIKGRLSSDMAEAFIFALRLLVIYNDSLSNKIISYCKALSDDKEFLMSKSM